MNEVVHLKKCADCGEAKPLMKGRLICRDCRNLNQRVQRRDNLDQHLKDNRNGKVKHYGIKYIGDINEWYEEQLKRQGGKCAIADCFSVPQIQPHKRLYMDHNHKTKELRGLLCNRCNMILGVIEEGRIEVFQQYLAEYSD